MSKRLSFQSDFSLERNGISSRFLSTAKRSNYFDGDSKHWGNYPSLTIPQDPYYSRPKGRPYRSPIMSTSALLSEKRSYDPSTMFSSAFIQTLNHAPTRATEENRFSARNFNKMELKSSLQQNAEPFGKKLSQIIYETPASQNALERNPSRSNMRQSQRIEPPNDNAKLFNEKVPRLSYLIDIDSKATTSDTNFYRNMTTSKTLNGNPSNEKKSATPVKNILRESYGIKGELLSSRDHERTTSSNNQNVFKSRLDEPLKGNRPENDDCKRFNSFSTKAPSIKLHQTNNLTTAGNLNTDIRSSNSYQSLNISQKYSFDRLNVTEPQPKKSILKKPGSRLHFKQQKKSVTINEHNNSSYLYEKPDYHFCPTKAMKNSITRDSRRTNNRQALRSALSHELPYKPRLSVERAKTPDFHLSSLNSSAFALQDRFVRGQPGVTVKCITIGNGMDLQANTRYY